MNWVFDLLRETVTAPRAAARRLIAYELDLGSSLALFGVSVIASVALMFALSNFQPITLFPGLPDFTPISLALTMAAGNLFLIAGLMAAGRAFGGQGPFTTGVLLLGWLQVLQVSVQIVQVLALIISPLVAGLLGLLGLALVVWVLFSFIAVWLNFEGLGRAVMSFFLAIFGLSLALSIVLVIVGVTPPEVSAL